MDTCTVEIDKTDIYFQILSYNICPATKKQQNPQSPALASAIVALRFELA